MRYLSLLLLASLGFACSDDASEPSDTLDAGPDANAARMDALVPLDEADAPRDVRDARSDAQLVTQIPGCTLDRRYNFLISNGGSTSYDHALEGSTLTLRARVVGATSQCDAPLGPCGDPSRVDAIDLKLALSADDVRDRFADSALEGSYGSGSDPVFVNSPLWVLTIVRDDGKLLQVGGWDCAPALVGCRPIPPGMRALRELLRELAEQRWVRFPPLPFSGPCAELQGS
jgi:hypothetical protein